jgi:DNA-binding transcriptional regulator YiaG
MKDDVFLRDNKKEGCKVNEIRKARLAAGLTQKSMSNLLEIPKRTIEDWETGRRQCPLYVKRFVLKELELLKSKK